MGVSQPVSGYRLVYAGLLRRTFHHAVDGLLCEPASALAACEHRIIGAGVAA